MDTAILDALRSTWPPDDVEEDRGYRRVSLATMRPLDAVVLPQPDGRRAAVAVVEAVEGLAAVPLAHRDGRWRLAVPGDGASEALVALIAGSTRVPHPFAIDRLVAFPALAGERAIDVDQTNRSVVVGDATVVKWYTQPGSDGSRAATLLAHLASVGFDGVPRPYGTLAWAPEGRPARPIAIVDEHIAEARDGWDWCVEAVVEHASPGHRCGPGCPSAFARDLGTLVGRLHVALASPSSVLPRPVTTSTGSDRASWFAAAIDDHDAALAVDADDRAALLAVAPRLRHDLEHIADLGATPVQPIHGDLHVGQVLHAPTGMRMIDFDGPPSGPSGIAQEPTARDVAHLLVSLELVAEVARKRLDGDRTDALATWADRARASLLGAYRAAIGAPPASTPLDERLLRPFVAHELCRELRYAATILPRWRYAPMGALARLYPAERT